ncbi:MAG: sigma-70 family RNA polymerase sigma factor [Chitinophagales bacterium]|nr:sigma-70 family RNA polymerase sigma factor [Chitinophagales bacterium]MCZ2393952.1 sigma-70 family RNA polymerase sigma factor [Chitinophagales bacterium]
MKTTYCVGMTDFELVKDYQKGDIEALNILIQRHKKRIFTSIIILVKDQYLAEDIFQETFVKVIDSLKSNVYKEEGKFLPWVMRISHNLCIDYFRKIKRKPVIVDSEGNDILESIGFLDKNVEDILIREQNILTLKQLIKLLPDEQREVLVLRHYAELSFKEIAEMTGVSINTALGRMRYALINLRKMIEEQKLQLF